MKEICVYHVRLFVVLVNLIINRLCAYLVIIYIIIIAHHRKIVFLVKKVNMEITIHNNVYNVILFVNIVMDNNLINVCNVMILLN